MPRGNKFQNVFELRSRSPYKEIITAFKEIGKNNQKCKFLRVAVLLLNSAYVGKRHDTQYLAAVRAITNDSSITISDRSKLEKRYLVPLRETLKLPPDGLKDPTSSRYLTYADLFNNYLQTLIKFGLIERTEERGTYTLGNRDLRIAAKQGDLNSIKKFDISQISTYSEINANRRGSGIFTLYGVNLDEFFDRREEIKEHTNNIIQSTLRIVSIAIEKFETEWEKERQKIKDEKFRELLELPKNPSISEEILKPTSDYYYISKASRNTNYALITLVGMEHFSEDERENIIKRRTSQFGERFAEIVIEKFLPIYLKYWPRGVVCVSRPIILPL